MTTAIKKGYINMELKLGDVSQRLNDGVLEHKAELLALKRSDGAYERSALDIGQDACGL